MNRTETADTRIHNWLRIRSMRRPALVTSLLRIGRRLMDQRLSLPERQCFAIKIDKV